MSIRSRQRRGRRAQTVIDITSLLDIIFLLIIFLIVSTTFRKSEHAFTVELPTAGTETESVTTDKTTVYVTRDGRFFLLEQGAEEAGAAPRDPGAPVDRAVLESRLRALHAASPDGPIAVRGEKEASYQRLMDAVSVLQAIGFRAIHLPYEHEAPAP
jgi:biopolymer transport protein ExbD